MYVQSFITSSRVWINRVRIWLSILCLWSAEQQKCFFLGPRSRLRIWLGETGSAVPSSVSPLLFHTQAESGAYSHGYSRFPRRRPFMYTVPSNATGSVPSLSSQAIAYRWRSTPRFHLRRASCPQLSLRNGCCLFRQPHGPIDAGLSFPTVHPLMVRSACPRLP